MLSRRQTEKFNIERKKSLKIVSSKERKKSSGPARVSPFPIHLLNLNLENPSFALPSTRTDGVREQTKEEDKYEDDSCIACNQNNQTINKTTLQQSKSSGQNIHSENSKFLGKLFKSNNLKAVYNQKENDTNKKKGEEEHKTSFVKLIQKFGAENITQQAGVMAEEKSDSSDSSFFESESDDNIECSDSFNQEEIQIMNSVIACKDFINQDIYNDSSLIQYNSNNDTLNDGGSSEESNEAHNEESFENQFRIKVTRSSNNIRESPENNKIFLKSFDSKSELRNRRLNSVDNNDNAFYKENRSHLSVMSREEKKISLPPLK